MRSKLKTAGGRSVTVTGAVLASQVMGITCSVTLSPAGGTLMDAGCYCAHTLRFFPGCSRPKVRAAHAEKLVDYGRVDGHMSAELSYPPLEGSVLCAGTVGRLEADLRHMSLWPTTKFTALGTK
eukprot:GHRR01036284.1.p1 GENE.GHRR01036284.1~~GHRR01036284.1.p1  ORF type:complete len:124 (-),score=23.81 GHRR01036284.1:510-881(-)